MNTTNPIQRYLAANNKSQQELADAMKVSQVTIADWASGKKIPRTKKLRKLAKLIGSDESLLILELHKPHL